jgi:putative transposase
MLKSQPSQCTLQALDKSWKSFFKAVKDWKKNPHKYNRMPKPPKYLNKKGRFPWYIKNNTCHIDGEKLIFQVKRLQGYEWETKAKGRLICVRFIPRGCVYVMEVVTQIEIPDFEERESQRIASVDLGISNLVTLTNNIGLQPIIINGNGVKSINQFYNKNLAKAKSEARIRNGQYISNRIKILDYKRNDRIKNYMHCTSRYIVNYCIANNIDTLVCGYNLRWKKSSGLGRMFNQSFVEIPYGILTRQLEYKCQEVGIKLVMTEESYTSGTSFLDGEMPCKENYDKSRRKKRGLFQAGNQLINADVNGSLQIMRKEFPNAFSYGIVGNLTPLIISVA